MTSYVTLANSHLLFGIGSENKSILNLDTVGVKPETVAVPKRHAGIKHYCLTMLNKIKAAR